jgi:GT2 family glycosyltransferase
MPLLSIIIPTYNRGEILHQTLGHARDAVNGVDAEIIVVNDSNAQKVILPEKFTGHVKVIDSPNPGAASGRNSGVKHSNGELLLFTDDDIIISKENINRTLEFNRLHPNACLNLNWKYPDRLLEEMKRTKFGRFLIHVNLIDYKGWVYHGNWSDEKVFEVKKLSAFYLFMPKKIFLQTGGFNESFKNQSVEDDEFSSRLLKTGIRLYIDPTGCVLHNETDKINLKARLKRLKTGAFNKREAYEMGMQEYHIPYSPLKIYAYSLLSACKGVVFFFSLLVPNTSLLDFLYRRLVHLLIGTVIFEGYYLHKNEPEKRKI